MGGAVIPVKMKNIDFKRLAAILFCAACAALAAYLVLKYAIGLISPFIIAYILGSAVNRPARAISKKLRLPIGLTSALMLILLLSAISAAVWIFLGHLMSESKRLLSQLSDGSTPLGGSLAALLDRLSSLSDNPIRLPDRLINNGTLRKLVEGADSAIYGAVSNALSSLTGALTRLFIGVFSGLPSFLTFVSVTLIASFYLCIDYEKIKSKTLALLPTSALSTLGRVKARVCRAFRGILRAYLLLFLMTFIELFVGFSILGTSYPFLTALPIALLDLLPILGVGAVLIPWGLIRLILFRDMVGGMGLLILYAVIVVVRQITEPRIVSGSLGLHPLSTLMAMYVGFRVLGVFGMILGPIALTAAVAVIRAAPSDTGIDKETGL